MGELISSPWFRTSIRNMGSALGITSTLVKICDAMEVAGLNGAQHSAQCRGL